MEGNFLLKHLLTFKIPNNFSENKDASLLVIVMDTNPSQRIIRENPHHLTQCLDSIVAFANAHLMQKAQNKLAVLACHHHAT